MMTVIARVNPVHHVMDAEQHASGRQPLNQSRQLESQVCL